MSVYVDKAYIHPHDSSAFGIVTGHYLESLKEHYFVRDIPMIAGHFYMKIFRFGDVIIHPFLPCAIRGYYPKARSIIACEIAEGDRMSKKAVRCINKADMLIVPSMWVKESYLASGLKIPVEIVPHGFPDEWLTKPKKRISNMMLRLMRSKSDRRCLWFYIHSWWRKGGNLVVKVMKEIQKLFDDVWLGVKVGIRAPPLPDEINEVKHDVIAGFYSELQLVDIYDTHDVLLMFSRGGSFEINALEAVSRGLVVLYPEKSCVAEYMGDYGVAVKSTKRVRAMPDDEFHIGYAYEIDVDDAITKLKDVLENLDEYKARAEEFPIGLWTWRSVGEKFVKAVRKVWDKQ